MTRDYTAEHPTFHGDVKTDGAFVRRISVCSCHPTKVDLAEFDGAESREHENVRRPVDPRPRPRIWARVLALFGGAR